MSDQPKKPETFRDVAKNIVDMLFEAKALREDITRDQMKETEDAITDLMQSRWESHLRAQAMIEQLKKSKVIA